MIRLPGEKKCCGCSACYAACPMHAISMRADSEGFYNPIVEHSKCVECGLCMKVCPVLNHGKARKPQSVYALKAKDDELRAGSASGGAFTLFAHEILRRNGIVYGAGFNHCSWKVIHKYAFDFDELDDLRGSKYVQSDMGDTFSHVKSQLATGREVLFSGCPCQIAGLKRFLGREFTNLITVDLICHGVPSPLAWERYVEEREKKTGAHIKRILFRRFNTWRKYAISLEFSTSNEIAYNAEMQNDPFLRAFLNEWSVRKGCYNCSFRKLRSGSDITIGDFWGVEKCYPAIEDAKGVSIVLLHSDKAKFLMSDISDSAELLETSFEIACVADNAIPLLKNCTPSRLRDCFFQNLRKCDFDVLSARLAKKCQGSIVLNCLWWLKRLLINGEINRI